ncbi:MULTISPECIES: cell division protein ZapA [unclassified Pseudoalteromonas]|uniref:cell division protein ZapA n=1 Tax=unclassified Pseudoalteromonas TaxID=194690 RepID=UPI002097A288|nr:cell division protein ZapA [Pseudoalteromonas sp. XMcav2-N]MCO7189459.1 cell division protein ZapA [Pseudoalteromonas sp. XMcav2-N]
MSESPEQVTVTLLGKSHQFSCTPGQQQALIDAVGLLNGRVDEMRQRDTVRSDHNALLLAALHLCHELLALQSDTQQVEQTLQQLTQRISTQMERA